MPKRYLFVRFPFVHSKQPVHVCASSTDRLLCDRVRVPCKCQCLICRAMQTSGGVRERSVQRNSHKRRREDTIPIVKGKSSKPKLSTNNKISATVNADRPIVVLPTYIELVKHCLGILGDTLPPELVSIIVSYVRHKWMFAPVGTLLNDQRSVSGNTFAVDWHSCFQARSTEGLYPSVEMTLTIGFGGSFKSAHPFDGMSLSVVPRWCTDFGTTKDGYAPNAYTLVVGGQNYDHTTGVVTPPDNLMLVDHTRYITHTMCVRDTPLNIKPGWTIQMRVRPATEADDCFGPSSYSGYRGPRTTADCKCATPNLYGDDCGACDQCGYVPQNCDPSLYSIVTFACNDTPLGVGEKYKDHIKRRILTARLQDYCLRIDARPATFRFHHN